jgi:hypothetical protein
LRRFLIPLASLVSIVLLVACGSGDTPSDPTAAPSPPSADVDVIHTIDFSQDAATKDLLAKVGSGRVASDEILYADLTGDQKDEAVVPITSEGTLGNIAYIVLTMSSGKPSAILTRTMDRSAGSGLRMTVDSDKLKEVVGVMGPSDPLCCPSELRTTIFRWDGSRLQVDGETTVKQPSAKD